MKSSYVLSPMRSESKSSSSPNNEVPFTFRSETLRRTQPSRSRSPILEDRLSPPPQKKRKGPKTIASVKTARAYEKTLKHTLLSVAETMSEADEKNYDKLLSVYIDDQKTMKKVGLNLRDSDLKTLIWSDKNINETLNEE